MEKAEENCKEENSGIFFREGTRKVNADELAIIVGSRKFLSFEQLDHKVN